MFQIDAIVFCVDINILSRYNDAIESECNIYIINLIITPMYRMMLRDIRYIFIFIFALAATNLSVFGADAAEKNFARLSIKAPTSVILYIHPTVRDRRFVEPLACALERVLVAPVTVQDLALPLGPELFINRRQIDATAAVDYFANSVPPPYGEMTFRTLIIAPDLKTWESNYTFSQTKFFVGSSSKVLSIARFINHKPDLTGQEIPLLTQRLYKSILRSIVQSAGHLDMTGCVMAYPHSVLEHDAKPAYLCPADHALLVEEGVLREHEKSNCNDEIAKYEYPARLNGRRRQI